VSARPERDGQAAALEARTAQPTTQSAERGTQGFAILRRQTEEELVISEVHAQLDRVLAFLQQAVGYSLLDDARPQLGGAVVLTPRRLHVPQLLDCGQVRDRSRRGRGGERNGRLTRLPTEEPNVPDEEARRVLRLYISRGTARYARYPDDLVLVWRLGERLVEGAPQAAAVVRTEGFYKTVLKGVRLMHLCGFSYSDVVVTLAYASAYFIQAFADCGGRMGNDEAAHVCVLLIYLAQIFVLDEICPLSCWQHHVFRNYCDVRILNAALFRLFHLRGFQLRISEEEEQRALKALLLTSEQIELILGLDDPAPALRSSEARLWTVSRIDTSPDAADDLTVTTETVRAEPVETLRAEGEKIEEEDGGVRNADANDACGLDDIGPTVISTLVHSSVKAALMTDEDPALLANGANSHERPAHA